jgi:2-methylcitrate dehydratase PrpD
VCSVFAAAVAGARILKLNENQFRDALGLALNYAAGSGENNIEGAQAVSLVAGIAAQGGLLSAQLAGRGITGPRGFLEGPKGWVSMFGTSKADPDLVAGQLGSRYELEKTLFKRFPSCGLTQTSTQGILEIMNENSVKAADIAKVDVMVGDFASTVVGHFEIGRNPTMNAKFSIPFCIANALLRGSSELSHFEENMVRDPEIAKLAGLVHIITDPAVEKREQRAMEMDVHTRDGKTFHRRIDVPRGSPGNEMTADEKLATFRQCAAYGKKPLSKKNTERIIDLVGGMENMKDIRDLLPLMTA